MLLISACLLGAKVKYNGSSNYCTLLAKYKDCGLFIPICPECLGQLTIPRLPAEITGGVVSNMSIAVERRDFLKHFDCFICNQLEAGMLFMEDYADKSPEELRDILSKRVILGKIPAMIVTMGGNGAVYADVNGEKGIIQDDK